MSGTCMRTLMSLCDSTCFCSLFLLAYLLQTPSSTRYAARVRKALTVNLLLSLPSFPTHFSKYRTDCI